MNICLNALNNKYLSSRHYLGGWKHYNPQEGQGSALMVLIFQGGEADSNKVNVNNQARGIENVI